MNGTVNCVLFGKQNTLLENKVKMKYNNIETVDETAMPCSLFRTRVPPMVRLTLTERLPEWT